MNTLINTSSLIGLFLLSIVSFTILPGPSDAAVVGSFAFGLSPVEVILVASFGAMIARAINHYIGSLGETYVVQKKGWLKPKQVKRSKKLFDKYGPWVLLFTWLPFIDDPLTVVAGFLRYPFRQYMIYTTIAIFIRHIGLYAIYLWFT
jgi:membrane protein YqaA with SNARE-associated domain